MVPRRRRRDTTRREELRDAVRRLEDARDQLDTDEGGNSPRAIEALESVDGSLSVVSFEASALADLPTATPATTRKPIVRRIRAQEVALAGQMSMAVRQVEDGASASIDRLRWVSFGLFGLLLLSLGGEVWFVVRPAIRRLEEDVDELAGAEQAVLEAADQERVRLGQEMHDGLCQHLGGLRLLTRAVRSSTSEEATRKSLDMIAELAERSLKMTRSFSHGLYPGEVKAMNLATAIERLGSEAAEVDIFKFSFDTSIDNTPPLDDDAAMQLYRIAQEALSNAARHGRPGHISIELGCTSSRLWLSIQDDGVGMSTTMDTLAGAGLSSMRARARAMDADLTISSMPGHGTRVDVTLDLPATAV